MGRRGGEENTAPERDGKVEKLRESVEDRVRRRWNDEDDVQGFSRRKRGKGGAGVCWVGQLSESAKPAKREGYESRFRVAGDWCWAKGVGGSSFQPPISVFVCACSTSAV